MFKFTYKKRQKKKPTLLRSVKMQETKNVWTAGRISESNSKHSFFLLTKLKISVVNKWRKHKWTWMIFKLETSEYSFSKRSVFNIIVSRPTLGINSESTHFSINLFQTGLIKLHTDDIETAFFHYGYQCGLSTQSRTRNCDMLEAFICSTMSAEKLVII